MIIEHLCLNVIDIEKEKNFYCAAFGFEANAKYHNAKTGWENYFLSAPDGGARLELLSHADMPHTQKDAKDSGLIHFALSLGSKETVDKTTAQIQAMGFQVLSGPRLTGDGYYESCFLDPEGNRVELTI